MTTNVLMTQRLDNKLCFDFTQNRETWREHGKNARGMTCFDIDVVFHKGNRKAGFYVYAPTIQVALEIIEGYGRQFQNMEDAEFGEFAKAHAGRTIFFHSLHKQKLGAEKIVFFKPDRLQKILELSFGTPPSRTLRSLDIEYDIVNHIDGRVQEEEKLKATKKKKPLITTNNNNLNGKEEIPLTIKN